MLIKGTNNKLIEIDLSLRNYKFIKINNSDLKNYIGGKGIGLKYLFDNLDLNIDPLDPENILVIITGVLIGSGAPCSNRWEVCSKSPLTNIIGTSSCGGPFGISLKSIGFDGVIIKGKSEDKIYIEIYKDKVKFIKADNLWGLSTIETQKKLSLGKYDGECVIGPAGENKVLFANIMSGHRFAGRCGFGAVMGSKNLKAIVARGEKIDFEAVKKKMFEKIKKKSIKFINRNTMTSKNFRKYGTTYNVNICNKNEILPVNNFKYRYSDNAKSVSGEYMQQEYNTKPNSCKTCLILCGHKGTYKDGTIHQIPEYETTGLFGPNLGIYDTDFITLCNDLCNELGIDTISMAGTLAYLMEATEKRIIKTYLKFGCKDGILEIIKDTGYRKGIGYEIANGSKWLSEKYGGRDFAINVKGLEIAAYDPKGSWGQGLNYAVANRGGCHLSSFLVGPEVFLKYLNPYSIKSKAKWVDFFENLNCGINSLQTCQFTLFAYILENFLIKITPKFILSFFMTFFPNLAIFLMNWSIYSDYFYAITGIKMSKWDFIKAGKKIHILERYMNVLIGITKNDDRLPERLIEDKYSKSKNNKPVPLEKMLKQYYKIKGYDQNGIPLEKTLKKLNINIPDRK